MKNTKQQSIENNDNNAWKLMYNRLKENLKSARDTKATIQRKKILKVDKLPN